MKAKCSLYCMHHLLNYYYSTVKKKKKEEKGAQMLETLKQSIEKTC